MSTAVPSLHLWVLRSESHAECPPGYEEWHSSRLPTHGVGGSLRSGEGCRRRSGEARKEVKAGNGGM